MRREWWRRRDCGCGWFRRHDTDCLWELPVLTEPNPNERPFDQDE